MVRWLRETEPSGTQRNEAMLRRSAQRLESWGEKLPEDEQRVLKLMLSRPAFPPGAEAELPTLS